MLSAHAEENFGLAPAGRIACREAARALVAKAALLVRRINVNVMTILSSIISIAAMFHRKDVVCRNRSCRVMFGIPQAIHRPADHNRTLDEGAKMPNGKI
jgi:hypothetical protein